MRMDCGCEFRSIPVEDEPAPMTEIRPCGTGHYVVILRGVGDLVETLEDADIETGEKR